MVRPERGDVRRERTGAGRGPDAVVPGRPPRRIFMRRYLDAVLQTEMLLRVVVEETAKEFLVVTLYKTSKFKKYERGSRP